MKVDVDKEWFEEAAKREGDAEVGAGPLAALPDPQVWAVVVALRELLAFAHIQLQKGTTSG